MHVSSLTCALPVVARPQQGAGLLVFSLRLVVSVVGEGVYALVAAGVAVCVVDHHVVRGHRQVDPQLVTGETALRLGGTGTLRLSLRSSLTI